MNEYWVRLPGIHNTAIGMVTTGDVFAVGTKVVVVNNRWVLGTVVPDRRLSGKDA